MAFYYNIRPNDETFTVENITIGQERFGYPFVKGMFFYLTKTELGKNELCYKRLFLMFFCFQGKKVVLLM